ncbi:MAG: D-TA family PLP-dependent enzyme [Planctomycetales bacterium]|nr:D-TA family PLP-dependent enzyme [Planctomycetales bacterium]
MNLSADATADAWSRIPHAPAQVRGIEAIASPSLLVFDELLERNLHEMIRIAGVAARLRPHCKTHKISRVIERELSLGIRKHKCATIAEAEMLAAAGVPDIFIAYPIVGPNIDRVVRLAQRFPDATWRVSGDHWGSLVQLNSAAAASSVRIGVVVDLDPGMHRTGIPIDSGAAELYRRISELENLRADGFQLYDGHHRQADVAERQTAVNEIWSRTALLADQLQAEGLPAPRVVAGGTGSFPCFAAIDDPRLELSPGTVVFHDAGYLRAFPDLDFTPAAVLLTRVIDLPGPGRITVDLGHKAVAADPAAGQRVWFPALPQAREVIHSEEHLVLEVDGSISLEPGDALFAIPRHICPTTALHQEVHVVSGGAIAGCWPVDARNRRLSI